MDELLAAVESVEDDSNTIITNVESEPSSSEEYHAIFTNMQHVLSVVSNESLETESV